MPKLNFNRLIHPIETLQTIQYHFLTKPNRNQFLATLLRAFTPIAEPEKWVFIIGCYNSGTTLLEKMLATHPAISAIDEGVFKTDQLLTEAELGWPRMWSQVIDQVRLKSGDQTVDAKALKKDWAIFLDRKRSVFLEKSIVNSARLLWLQDNFQNAYFIFIVRNGYAVAEGIRRKASRGKWSMPPEFKQYPIKLCAKQWVINNQIVEQDAPKISNLIKIHYETLCQRPQQTIEELWDFIGLKSSLSWSNDKQWAIQEKESQIKNMNQRSLDNLSSADIEEIEEVAAEMLEYYSYPILSRERE